MARTTPNDNQIEREKALNTAFNGGSLKQRIRLYFSESDKEYYHKPSLLTAMELEHLGNILRNYRAFNSRYIAAQNVHKCTDELEIALRMVMRNVMATRVYIERWAMLETLEEAVNIALLALPDAERTATATTIANRVNVENCSQIVEPSGLLHFLTEGKKGENDLKELMEECKEVLISHFGEFKGMAKAVKDFIDQMGIGMPETKAIIKSYEDELRSNVELRSKYKIQPTTIENNTISGLYDILPKYEDVEILDIGYTSTMDILKRKQ